MSWRFGRFEAIAACLLLAGCGPELDYGQCLQSHTRPASIKILPMPDGKGGIKFMYIPKPEEEVCDQWEYPEGRHIMEGVGK